MPDQLQATLTISDPRLDDDERETAIQVLYKQLMEAEDNLGNFTRVLQTAPSDAKSFESAVVGVLTAALSAGALKAFFDYLKERWRGHEITLDLHTKTRKVKLAVRKPEDLVVAYHAAAALLRHEDEGKEG